VANKKKLKLKKKSSQHHIGEFGELDGGGGIPENKFFTMVQIKPKILQK